MTSIEGTVDKLAAKVDGMDSRTSEAERMSQKAIQGVAIALSVSDPVLVNGDVFGVRINYGTFDGQGAVGLSMQGILTRDLFGNGETLALGGGIGVGLNDHSVGGRVGLQLSWK